MSRVRTVLAVAASLLLVAGVGWTVQATLFAQQAPTLVTARASIGDIEEVVLATGTLKPLKLVAVGAQVSGRVISLLVGGIGVMNIMLVSVSERTGEIGVRMAVGARRSDILQQFLIEAVLVCVLGGLLGVASALGFGLAFRAAGSEFQLVYSGTSIAAAVLCSTLIGVAFGYLPARNASRLDPVVALARD